MDGYHTISELCPMITGWTICVFVVRVFKKFVAPNVFEIGLILADESVISRPLLFFYQHTTHLLKSYLLFHHNLQGSRSRIEATIDRRLAPFYLDRLKENEWKIITSFSVRKNADPVKTTAHEYGIWFLDRTVVTNALRRDAFNFYDFTQFDYIIQKTVDKNVLVGE